VLAFVCFLGLDLWIFATSEALLKSLEAHHDANLLPLPGGI